MSHDRYQKSRLHKGLLEVPARWTDKQPDFLRFSFPPSSTPAPAPEEAPSSYNRGDSDIQKVRDDLQFPDSLSRHTGMARLFSAPPPSSQPGEKLALLFQRRRLFFDCVVLPQLDSSGQEIRFLAYADEWHIILQKNLARKRCERQSLRRDNYNPYIAALLIAVAQAHDDREAPYITASVLYTANPADPTRMHVEDIYLYTARIPRPLLDFFRRPKGILPAYDPIRVSCVSIPVEPLESLRERIFLAIPGGGRDDATEKETAEGK